MATSCSHWWHAPIYTALSVALITIFIFLNVPSNPHLQPHHLSTQIPPPPLSDSDSDSDSDHFNNFITHSLINATLILRSNGFNFIATLLHLSPHLFLSSPPSTIFAIHDSAISNLALPPSILQQLLLYHTLPYRYSMKQLLRKPVNTCFQTRVPLKNVGITKRGGDEIEINNVLVSHPDLFLDGPFSIQGVLKPFSLLNNVDQESNWDIAQLPVCDSINYGIVSNNLKNRKRNEWRRVVQLLSLNAFIPFAIGLHSVIDNILQDHHNLTSVTVFTPPNMAVLSLPSPLLDKFVRFHILNQSFSFEELASLPKKGSLRTLVHGKDLVVTSSVHGVAKVLAINGVEVTAPDIFSSSKLSVHGVARALIGMEELLAA